MIATRSTGPHAAITASDSAGVKIRGSARAVVGNRGNPASGLAVILSSFAAVSSIVLSSSRSLLIVVALTDPRRRVWYSVTRVGVIAVRRPGNVSIMRWIRLRSARGFLRCGSLCSRYHAPNVARVGAVGVVVGVDVSRWPGETSTSRAIGRFYRVRQC